jgi:hypothetical protein
MAPRKPILRRKVLAYLRRYEEETLLFLANVSHAPQAAELDLAEFRGYSGPKAKRSGMPGCPDRKTFRQIRVSACETYVDGLMASTFSWKSLPNYENRPLSNSKPIMSLIFSVHRCLYVTLGFTASACKL